MASGDGEPDSKRPRTGTLNNVVKNVSWADIEEEGPSGIACFSLRCDHCDQEFPSRNALFAHLRAVRQDESELLVSQVRKDNPSRSVADGLAHTDETARGGVYDDDPKGAPKVETSKRSRYDVCEVFSPARLTRRTSAHRLRGGWSLDLSQRCQVTGLSLHKRPQACRSRTT